MILQTGIIVFVWSNNAAAINIQKGEVLYKQYCTACHQVDSKLVGPALRDADKRRPDDWLISWVRNNQLLRSSGDKDAVALFQGYNVEMPSFTQLSSDDVRSIMAYIDSRPAGTASTPPDLSAPFQLYLMYLAMGLFVIIIFFLLRTNFLLARHIFELMHKAPGKKAW